MDVYFWNSRHAVYSSLLKVFSFVELKKYSNYPLFKLFTTHLEDSTQKIRSNSIYITKSPLISLFTWKIKLNSAKAFIFEEYFQKRRVKDLYSRFLLSFFKDYPFIAMTKRTYSFLSKEGFKVFFVPPAEKKRDYSFKRKYITMVSRLVPSKNITLFLELVEQFPNENFLLIGKGILSKEVKKFEEKHDNFKYIEYLEDKEDVFKYYSRSKMLIHPPFKDPIGFVVIEALSCSTPVLATSSTGASDFLPEEWKLNSFNINDWTGKVSSILEKEKENINKASTTFQSEHLNISDKYFEIKSKEIQQYIQKKWNFKI